MYLVFEICFVGLSFWFGLDLLTFDLFWFLIGVLVVVDLGFDCLLFVFLLVCGCL